MEMRAGGAPAEDIERVEHILREARNLHEQNPMMGLRGCRLGLLWPEIYEMQARAIFQACAALVKEGCEGILPEVMIPLIGQTSELAILRELVEKVATEVKEEEGVDFPVVIGTMIEVPRSTLIADDVARYAQFFSFGTNDLTQMVYGFSRDDAEARFIHRYLELGIMKENPFAVLDREGVGHLVKMGVDLGRSTRPDLVIGVCGEHGGEPQSVEFFHQVGLTYVSCSPFRVPVARLAAAQAALKEKARQN